MRGRIDTNCLPTDLSPVAKRRRVEARSAKAGATVACKDRRGKYMVRSYTNPDTSAYGDVERIVGSFRALPEGKDAIVYCYSMPCMTGRKIGKMLTEHGIYVQHLGIGWNEWRHFWNLWNHEHEWSATKVEDYIVSGAEPGEPKSTPGISPCIDGEFGC